MALTGPALQHIIDNRDKDPVTFYSVCSKAQVYARMSPSDKESLIENL